MGKDEENRPNPADESPSFPNPHDLFAKVAFGDPERAGDFLWHYADPVIHKHIDLDQLEPIANQFFSAGFQQISLDIPFVSRLRDKTGKAEVLMVLEHKSFPCVFTALQVDTCAHVVNYTEWKNAGRPQSKKNFKLRIPIGVVIYCGDSEWIEEMHTDDMYDDVPEELWDYISRHKIVFINLNRYGYGQLRGRPSTQAAVETLKRAKDGTFKANLPYILQKVSSDLLEKRIDDLLIGICSYCNIVTDISQTEIDEAIKQTFHGERGAQMAEAVQKGMWVVGFESGVAKGRADEKVASKVDAILKFLRSRFGYVSDDIIAALGKMNDPIALDSLIECTATCVSLEDFVDSL